MNRAEQNWPADHVIVIDGPAVNPYCHELNSEGTGCANDCPACMFIELNFLDIELRSRYSEPVDEFERRTR